MVNSRKHWVQQKKDVKLKKHAKKTIEKRQLTLNQLIRRISTTESTDTSDFGLMILKKLTALRDSIGGGHIAVLPVHVVDARARVVAQPDAEVLDGQRLATRDLKPHLCS